MSLLDQRVAFITGGTRGIGRGIAEAFLAQGAAVVLGGRDTAVGERVVDELGGERVSFVPCDVTDRAQVDHLVDETVRRHGRLDIAVLNAGGVDKTAPVADMTDEEWDYELALNLTHTFVGIRRALKHMLPAGRGGRILSISSVEGKHGRGRVAGYVANKHAINGLTKAVAKEVGPDGITVNAICPGLVVTDMLLSRAGKGLGLGGVDEVVALYAKETALGRVVTVEEVAATALFLASDAGAGITGALVSVDAGTAAY